MDALDDVSGTQRLTFALADRAAAHIAGRNCALLAQKDGAAGKCSFVLRVPDLQARDESKSSRHTRSIAKSKAAAEYRTYCAPSKVSPNSKCQQLRLSTRTSAALSRRVKSQSHADSGRAQLKRRRPQFSRPGVAQPASFPSAHR